MVFVRGVVPLNSGSLVRGECRLPYLFATTGDGRLTVKKEFLNYAINEVFVNNITEVSLVMKNNKPKRVSNLKLRKAPWTGYLIFQFLDIHRNV
jgi:hypothetical protein